MLNFATLSNVKATHIMGGEITWECIKTGPDVGKYIFTMKLYRDCDGVTLSTFAQTLDVHFSLTVTQITVDFVSNTDISPPCDVTNSGNPQHLDCQNNPVGAVENIILQHLLHYQVFLQWEVGFLHGILVVEMERHQI